MFSGVSSSSRTMTERTTSSFYNVILDYSVTLTYHKHFSKNVLELSSRPSLGIRTGFFQHLKYSSPSTTFSAVQQKAGNGHMSKSSCVSTSYPLLTAKGQHMRSWVPPALHSFRAQDINLICIKKPFPPIIHSLVKQRHFQKEKAAIRSVLFFTNTSKVLWNLIDLWNIPWHNGGCYKD